MKPCVFVGPTLRAAEAIEILGARCFPPVRQGDVYRVVSRLRPPAIGIVDGYFQGVPSVWHKEILWAMGQGVHVFGAASMGALRAAELHPFGMKGVGRIFEAYCAGFLEGCGEDAFEDDDEVAVVHGPDESGYIPASEAMVNVRLTLFAAGAAGVIGPETCARLVQIAKALFFPERTYGAILARGLECGLPVNELAAFEAWLPAGRVDQKRADALGMLSLMRDVLSEGPGRMRVDFVFERTALWDEAVAALQPPPLRHDEAGGLALNELRLDPGRFQKLRMDILDAMLERSPGDALTLSADPAAIPEPDLGEIDREAAYGAVETAIPLFVIEKRILATLRATGEYENLVARGRSKHRAVAGALPFDEVSKLDVLRFQNWFFEEILSTEIPDDLGQYVVEMGYPDETTFNAAIYEEHQYREMLAATERLPQHVHAGS